MGLKSIALTDYSTGSQNQYSGTDGTWQSITAVGGKVGSAGNGNAPIHANVAPSTTGTTNGPIPYQGTTLIPHRRSFSQTQVGGPPLHSRQAARQQLQHTRVYLLDGQ